MHHLRRRMAVTGPTGRTDRHTDTEPSNQEHVLPLPPVRKLVLYAHTGHQNYAYMHFIMSKVKKI